MSSPSQPHQPPQYKLYKQCTWSPDIHREEAWLRLKKNATMRRQCRKSVSDEDLEELKASIELGFGFTPDSPDLDPKLSETFPALEFYCDVNKNYYNNYLSRSTSSSSLSSSDSGSNYSYPIVSIVNTGDDPKMMKLRLKQWAQAVACSVKQFAGYIR